jgi:serine/threonine protein kinase
MVTCSVGRAAGPAEPAATSRLRHPGSASTTGDSRRTLGAVGGPGADLYALGAVAYQLLTGHPPFEGKTVVDVCSKHWLAEPAPPSSQGIDAPPALEAVILACLAKRPEGRPASAQRLREMLEAVELASWTSDEARSWWTNEAPRIMAAAKAERTDSISGPRATIAIDFARRSAMAPSALRQLRS